jgi:hypothetical protein
MYHESTGVDTAYQNAVTICMRCLSHLQARPEVQMRQEQVVERYQPLPEGACDCHVVGAGQQLSPCWNQAAESGMLPRNADVPNGS